MLKVCLVWHIFGLCAQGHYEVEAWRLPIWAASRRHFGQGRDFFSDELWT